MQSKVYTYRYVWKLKSSNTLNFKIVSDTIDGLTSFEKQLCQIPDIEMACKEYLHEYDCSLISRIDKVFGGDKNETNESC